MSSNRNFSRAFFLMALALQLSFFWPGMFMPDSSAQYAMAQAGVYSDHHPAFMSFIWHYLDLLHQGTGLMLTLNIIMLHAAAFVFYKAFAKGSKLTDKALSFLFLPWIPGVLAYGGVIQKDTAFAYAFMLVAALLTKAHMQNKKLGAVESIVLFAVLFYGTSVKFQAQYLAPIFLFWYVWQQFSQDRPSFVKKGMALLLTFGLFYGGLTAVNKALVPPTQQNHSWQFVKLFDLAAISIKNNETYIPKVNQGPTYSLENMKQTLLGGKFYNVDDLVFRENSLLEKGHNSQDREDLWRFWAQTVLKHPLDYVAHRFKVFAPSIRDISGFTHVKAKIQHHFEEGTPLYEIVYTLAHTVFFVFFAAIPIFLLGLFYLFLAVKTFRKAREAIPLLYILLVAYGMPAILFMFSMSGTPRYVIVSVCLIHTTHFMAWKCFKSLRS